MHIEVVESLDTDSFINCLQRFIARRGLPELIRSDNGRNFVGAERELRQGLQAWEQEKIEGDLSERGIWLIFNTPTASHMGGVWERQIRSVRRILSRLVREQVMSSEVLTTLLVTAEGILNNRPLTAASSDPSDLEPLTPNHLLTHRPARTQPGLYANGDSKRGGGRFCIWQTYSGGGGPGNTCHSSDSEPSGSDLIGMSIEET